MFRPSLALIALAVFSVSMALPGYTQTAAPQQDSQQTPKQEKQESKPAPKQEKPNSKETKYTAEQIVESVILVYGTRPALEHIRRNGVERGRITRVQR